VCENLPHWIGSVEIDWDGANGGCKIETLVYIIDDVDARGTAEDGRVGCKKTDGTGAEDCD